MNSKIWTKDEIINLISTRQDFVERALLKLLERQTSVEQRTEHTSNTNGVGFNKADAKMLTSFAKQLKNRTGYHLSQKQMKVARRRLPKYHKQLLEIANGKNAITPNPPITNFGGKGHMNPGHNITTALTKAEVDYETNSASSLREALEPIMPKINWTLSKTDNGAVYVTVASEFEQFQDPYEIEKNKIGIPDYICDGEGELIKIVYVIDQKLAKAFNLQSQVFVIYKD